MLRWFLAVAVATIAISSASAAFVLTTVPSVGPYVNTVGSGAYFANAAAGLRAGTDAGSVGTIGYYVPQGTATGGGLVNAITGTGGGVNSLWHGVVNDPAYPDGRGNALHMGLAITTTAGSTFTPAQVNFSGFDYVGAPPAFGAFNGFSAATLAFGNVYGSTTVGGTPVALTAADVGNSFAELYWAGAAFAYENNFPTDFTDAASLTAYFPHPLTPTGVITGSYSIGATTSNIGGTEINPAPAPAAFALMGLGFAGVMTRLRRRMA